MRTRLAAIVAILLSIGAEGSSPPLTVAAAADLQAILPELVRTFESESSIDVRLTFGSSGTFFAQIQNGAPFDVYLSADAEYPRTLVRLDKGHADSLYTYAVGQLVIWSRTGSGVALDRGLSALTDPAVTRVAIANPAHAPYGRAAIAALEAAGIADRVRHKLVLGENAAQAAQFVQSGNAQAGLLPLSLAVAPALAAAGEHVAVPTQLYPPILQAAVIVRASPRKASADRFLAFLRRPSTMDRLAQAGFLRP